MSDREIMDAKFGNLKTNQPTENHKQELPDAKKHQLISFIKSGIRIIGYFLLIVNLELAVTFLILSEGVGIIEELV